MIDISTKPANWQLFYSILVILRKLISFYLLNDHSMPPRVAVAIDLFDFDQI